MSFESGLTRRQAIKGLGIAAALGVAGASSGCGVWRAVADKDPKTGSFPRFGVSGAPIAKHLQLAQEAGIQIARERGVHISWYEREGELPDIGGRSVVDKWRMLKQGGIEPLIQIYLHNCADWAGTGLYHNGQRDKESVRPDVVADFAAHVVRSLPAYTYFKLGNEYDRDRRPKWQNAYADMMRAGYEAMKSARPEVVVAIEGGRSYRALHGLLEREVYEHADLIDHHLYGDAPWEPASHTYFPEKVRIIHKAGYYKPLIATEFGMTKGGLRGHSPSQVADLMRQRIPAFLDAGGHAFLYFPFAEDPIHKRRRRWNGAELVQADGSTHDPLYNAYRELAVS